MKNLLLILIALVLSNGLFAQWTRVTYPAVQNNAPITGNLGINLPTGQTYKINNVAISAAGEPALGNPGTNGWILSSTTSGTRSWISPGGGSMTWPAGGAGIPNYNGSSAWGTSYTTSGSGTVLSLTASPVFTGAITYPTPFTLGATSVTTTGTQFNYLNAATGITGTGSLAYSVSPTFTGTLNAATGVFSANLTAPNHIDGMSTVTTAAGTTTLTNTSNGIQQFTGSTTQTVVMPVASTLTVGQGYFIINNSTGILSIQSSGLNVITYVGPGTSVDVVCVLNSGTTAASWYDAVAPIGRTETASELSNTSYGNSALPLTTTGASNSAFGYQALNANTTGHDNLAFGIGSLSACTTGFSNVGMGTYTLHSVTVSPGAENTAVGYDALFNVINTGSNTAVGTRAGFTTTGSNSVFLGAWAGKYETGGSAFYVNNQDQTSTALDKTNSLMYGTFNSTPSNQTLTTNSLFTATYGVKTTHLLGSSASPTIAAGAAAGASPTVSINTSNDLAGTVTVTTGTTPTASAILVTVTFNVAFTGAKMPTVIISPANAATAALTGTSTPYISSTTLSTFVLSSNTAALTAATPYAWYFHVIQ
jgi:hypothetical protein